MKRGLKNLVVLVVFGLIFGMFLIGVVSAASINWANSTNGGSAWWTWYHSAHNMGHTGTAANIIDGNPSTYVRVYAQNGHPATRRIWANVTLQQPKDIDYIRRRLQNGQVIEIKVKQNGIWSSPVSTSTSNGWVTINGPWENVEEISFYLHSSPGDGYSYLYEIEAWGPEPCIPTLTCADDYPGQCGVGLNDGCEDILDCSDNCGFGEICQAGLCIIETEITGAYWADMADPLTEITEANLSDRVKLMVAGAGMETKEINYTIYKRCEGLGCIPAFFFGEEVFAQTATIGFITWRAGEKQEDKILYDGTFYFTAEIADVGTQTSGDLIVSDTEDNSPPHAEITSPKIGEIYFIGENVNFSQTSYDEDDFINYTWNLGDENTREGSTRDYVDYSFVYQYNSAEQMTINLNVEDERGLKDSDRTSILIIKSGIGEEGEYVFAHIDEPEWGENIRGFEVPFNASSSYAIETTDCTGTTCTINCLGGGCPDNTHDGTTIDPNNKKWNYTDLNFSWTFDDNTTYNAKGINGALFKKAFGRSGKHWARLTVSINPESSTETEFITSLNWICQIDLSTGKWIWWDESGEPQDPLTEPGACLDTDLTTNPPHCCPPGYSCEYTVDEDLLSAKCQISEDDYCANIVFCVDYLTQEECLNDTCGKGALQPGSTCGETIKVDAICGAEYYTSRQDECKCVWNDTYYGQGQGKCYHNADLWSSIYTDLPLVHKCGDSETTHRECIDGLMSVKLVGEVILIWNETYLEELLADPKIPLEYLDFPTGGTTDEVEAYLNGICNLEELCKNYEGTILCGRPLIKLIFFTIRNLIITICIIIIIYVIWLSRKNKKKQKKKK